MSLRAIVRLRFQWRSMIARSRRRIWASILRIICISEAEAIPKNPCQPRSHALIRAMQPSSVPPQFRGVSWRTRSIALRLVRSDSSTSTAPVCGSNRSRKPRKWRSSGRATADLAWFTFRRKRPSMNSVRLAITRCPARSLRTYTLASSA